MGQARAGYWRAPDPSVSRIAMTNAPPPPSSAAQSARTILTRLNEVMASRVNAQGKLNQVVGIIGECLDSEVCSIYLLRDGTLKLYATRGMSKQAAIGRA